VSAPGKRAAERTKDVVPLDPGPIIHGTGNLLEGSGLSAGVHTHGEEDEGDHAKKAGRHLGHNRAKDFGGWVLALPGHVLGLGHESGGRKWGSLRRGERDGGRSSHSGLRDRRESRTDGDDGSEEEEAELGHFYNIPVDTRDQVEISSMSKEWPRERGEQLATAPTEPSPL